MKFFNGLAKMAVLGMKRRAMQQPEVILKCSNGPESRAAPGMNGRAIGLLDGVISKYFNGLAIMAAHGMRIHVLGLLEITI